MEEVKFKRCVKLLKVIPRAEPDLVMFNNCNPSEFETSSQSGQGKEYTALPLISKAKLKPVAPIGDFTDSKIVLAIIRKSSYRFNTFAGL